jgi:hypothetical protein
MSTLETAPAIETEDGTQCLSQMKVRWRNIILLWFLFFMICLGLGYPTLKRYDPRMEQANVDSIDYYKLVVGSPDEGEGFRRCRVLVPYVAKPVYWLANGRVGTWEPVFFALLVANALFLATTACLIVSVAYRALSDYSIALLGAMLFLLNFAVQNFHLAGLVDSGEACLLMAVTWTLFVGRWPLLPMLGIFGALAKETFVPLAVVFAASWWMVTKQRDRSRISQLAWIASMGTLSLATVIIIQSTVYGHTVGLREIAFPVNSNSNYLERLFACISDRSFWYIFVWLLPLGIWKLGRLPRPWLLASLTSALTALALGGYRDSLGNAARPMFNAAGPVLSLSVALLLARLQNTNIALPGSQEPARERSNDEIKHSSDIAI